MVEPVGFIGTVVGVTSLAIQIVRILTDYVKEVDKFSQDIQDLLHEVNRLRLVSSELEKFLRADAKTDSQSFIATSTLYITSICCEDKLKALLDSLRRESEKGKRKNKLRALVWPFKSGEELQGYFSTFSLALSIDGCRSSSNRTHADDWPYPILYFASICLPFSFQTSEYV